MFLLLLLGKGSVEVVVVVEHYHLLDEMNFGNFHLVCFETLDFDLNYLMVNLYLVFHLHPGYPYFDYAFDFSFEIFFLFLP